MELGCNSARGVANHILDKNYILVLMAISHVRLARSAAAASRNFSAFETASSASEVQIKSAPTNAKLPQQQLKGSSVGRSVGCIEGEGGGKTHKALISLAARNFPALLLRS
jgi:hypothetical protein